MVKMSTEDRGVIIAKCGDYLESSEALLSAIHPLPLGFLFFLVCLEPIIIFFEIGMYWRVFRSESQKMRVCVLA